MTDIIADAKRLAEMNRTEGWNGNDCDEAMRLLNALARELEQCRQSLREAMCEGMLWREKYVDLEIHRASCCAEMESKLARVEALAVELESETFPRTLEGQSIESTQLRIAWKLRALTAPASGEAGE